MASIVDRTATKTSIAAAGVPVTRWRSTPDLVRSAVFPLSERTLLLLMLLGVAMATWPSLSTLFTLADGDTPVSFVPLVPLMGGVFLLRRFDGERIRAHHHDGFVDGLAVLLLGCVTLIVLLLLPVVMSWDYWLDRLDIPGVVLLLMTLVVAGWGLSGLAQLGPALLYLLLAWPLPYLLLYNHLIPMLTQETALAVRTAAPLLPLNIQADPETANGLLVAYQGHTTDIIVAQECAGMNGALGLAIIGLPIALLSRGSWEARGLWLVLGVGLSWLANVLRIVVIAAAAALWGPDMAMLLLHPVLGFVFFALSFGALLWLAPLCHLDIAAPWLRPGRAGTGDNVILAGTGAPSSQVVRWPRPRRNLLLLSAILVIGAMLDNNLNQFRWLSEAALPRVSLARSDQLFDVPPGWRRGEVEPINDWQPLYGSSTIAASLEVASPSQGSVYVQAVLTQDAQRLNAYGVEDCYTFHGFALQAVLRVPLGSGVMASLIDFQQGSYPVAALYWLQPVQTPQGLYHERIVLITDAHLARLRNPVRSSTSLLAANPVQRVASALEEFLSPWTAGAAGPSYQHANAVLQQLGQATIAWERRSEG